MSKPLNINVFGANYDNIEGICVSGTDNNTYTYIVPTGTISITENTVTDVIDITEYAAAQVNVMPESLRFQSKTINPSTSIITVTPDEEYDALNSVTIAAIPLGVAGQPVFKAANVYNHSITLTAVVTNSAGYIENSTKSVSYTIEADNLTSGELLVTSNGIQNISNYKTVNVNIPTGTINTPTIVRNSVANASITLTPKVVVTAGYINSGTITGSSMSISAAELVSGSRTITSNGNNINVVTLASVNVNVAGGSSVTPTFQTKTYTVSAAGTFTVSPDSGYNGLDNIQIIVPSAECVATNLQSSYKTEDNQRKWQTRWAVYGENAGWVDSGEINANSAIFNAIPSNTSIIPSTISQTIGGQNYMMEGPVIVNAIPSNYIIPTGTRTISNNGIVDVTDYANVDVNVAGSGSINLQTKTYTISAAGTFTITPDNGYNGLSSVQAIVPQGVLDTYDFGTENVTTISVSSSGLITAKTDLDSWFEPVLTSGYINNTNTAHIYINGTKTYQLSTQSGITVTPTTLQQTIVTAGKYTTGAIKVDAMPNGSTGTPVATKSAVVNNTITIKPTVTNTTGYITGGTITGSSITISAAELVSGIKTVTANGSWDVTKYATVSVNVPGGQEGSGDAELTEIQVDTKNTTLSTASFSIQFTGLIDEPTSFVIMSTDNVAMVSGMTTAIVYDGTYLHGQTLTTQVEASTDFNKSYSNGTLTITGGDSQFQIGTYKLIYSYEGSTTDVHTSDVQVGSGATNISFSGLAGKPLYWSCIFKSNFSTSSGYQRVIAVANDGTSTFGLDMDSSAHAASAWTATYNNGTLTIASQGTNNGGYFHQPGYYQLTYVTNEQIEVVSSAIDTKTVSASNSYPNSISFTNMLGEPKMFVCRCDTSISASGSTTYYYIINMTYNGTNTKGSYFRIGSTRQVTPVSSGYSWTYNNNTLTLTSSANDRSASPGTFYYGTYELIYAY